MCKKHDFLPNFRRNLDYSKFMIWSILFQDKCIGGIIVYVKEN